MLLGFVLGVLLAPFLYFFLLIGTVAVKITILKFKSRNEDDRSDKTE